MEIKTEAVDETEEEIPDSCLCDLCSQICDCEVDVKLSYYWREIEKK